MSQEAFEFVVYMIHACADKWHVTPMEAYQRMEQEGCISKYLVPFYDVLHTQGVNYLVSDIEQYMANRGVAVPQTIMPDQQCGGQA